LKEPGTVHALDQLDLRNQVYYVITSLQKIPKTSEIFKDFELNSKTYQGLSRALNLQPSNSSTFKEFQG